PTLSLPTFTILSVKTLLQKRCFRSAQELVVVFPLLRHSATAPALLYLPPSMAVAVAYVRSKTATSPYATFCHLPYLLRSYPTFCFYFLLTKAAFTKLLNSG